MNFSALDYRVIQSRERLLCAAYRKHRRRWKATSFKQVIFIPDYVRMVLRASPTIAVKLFSQKLTLFVFGVKVLFPPTKPNGYPELYCPTIIERGKPLP